MTANESTRTNDPELLEKRSIGGILIHLFALLTSVIGVGIVYLISNHEFTRENARNALNWHITVYALTAVAIVTFILGADELTMGDEVIELTLIPAPFDTIFFLAGIVLMALTMIAWMLTGIFALVATLKAIFGTSWEYPLSRDIIGK